VTAIVDWAEPWVAVRTTVSFLPVDDVNGWLESMSVKPAGTKEGLTGAGAALAVTPVTPMPASTATVVRKPPSRTDRGIHVMATVRRWGRMGSGDVYGVKPLRGGVHGVGSR
jgi:hypothetical protein